MVVFIFAVAGAGNRAAAQVNPSRTPAPAVADPTTAELQKHDLTWLKSGNDFDQKKFTEAQAETEIAYLIEKSRAVNTPIKDIEVSFNEAKLDYLGYIHPNDTNLFAGNPVKSNNSNSINKNLHVYRYGSFFVSSETDTEADQQNVYYTVRAINILRYRYPKAYAKLFVETGSHPTDAPRGLGLSNSYKAHWIAFNKTPDDIAASYASFVQEGAFPKSGGPTINRYRNVSVTNIHSGNIMGDAATQGSKVIYQNLDAAENYRPYMRDGLVETLVHEMLHRYIDHSYVVDERIKTIRLNRQGESFNLAEECAVMNTSLSYFMREGGLSDVVPAYYLSRIFNSNIKILESKNLLNSYAEVFSGSAAPSNNYREAFRLSVLD